MFCSVLFLSVPRSEGWPHDGRTFSIYLASVILIDSSTESPVHDRNKKRKNVEET